MKLLTPSAIKVARNKTVTIRMDGDYGQTYETTNPDIAQVAPDGTVTGIKAGSCILIAYVNGEMVSSCIVQVN